MRLVMHAWRIAVRKRYIVVFSPRASLDSGGSFSYTYFSAGVPNPTPAIAFAVFFLWSEPLIRSPRRKLEYEINLASPGDEHLRRSLS